MSAKKAGGVSVVRVTLDLPSGIIRFLKDLGAFGGTKIDPKAWCERELIAAGVATIDQISDDEFLVSESLRKKYGLQEDKEDP